MVFAVYAAHKVSYDIRALYVEYLLCMPHIMCIIACAVFVVFAVYAAHNVGCDIHALYVLYLLYVPYIMCAMRNVCHDICVLYV